MSKMFAFSLKYMGCGTILGDERNRLGIDPPRCLEVFRRTTGRRSYAVPAETPRRGK